jgi:hypothetical protein
VAVGATAVAVLAGCSSSDNTKVLVVQECKDSVQAQLTYNADFPFFDPTPEKDAAGTWHVSGTVTAQNGFGAKRTVPWTCTVDSHDNVRTSVG